MKIQDILCLVSAVVETFLFAGLVYGWPSLVSVLVAEGYFSDLCPPSETTGPNSSIESTTNIAATISHKHTSPQATSSQPFEEATRSTEKNTMCTRQQQSLTLVYTIMFAFTLLFSFGYGTLLDRLGTWITKTVSIVSVTIGLILLIASSSSTSWILFIAMPLLNSGGNSLLSTNIQVGNLFGKARNSVTSLITGATFSSSGVFFLVRAVYENGVGLNECFYFLLACTSFLWIKTFFLMPRTFLLFPQPEDRQKYGIVNEWIKRKSGNILVTPKRSVLERKKWNSRRACSVRGLTYKETQHKVNFKACICNPLYWTGTLFFAICTLRTSFYYGTFNISISQLAEPSDVGTYTIAFNVVVIAGVLIALLNGAVNDLMTKWFLKKEGTEDMARRNALLISTCCTITIAILMSTLATIRVLPLQYCTFISVVLLQSFSITTAIMYLTTMFPIEHFGKLFGLQFVTAGFFAFLQFPLTILGTNQLGGDFNAINIAFIIVCCMMYLHAFFLYKNLNTGLPKAALNPDGNKDTESLRDQREVNRNKYLKTYQASEQEPLSEA